MKILVTGAAGFIGSHTAEYFAKQGHTVYGLDNFDHFYDVGLKRRNQNELQSAGVQFVEADLLDDLKLILPQNFDYIFHFAAQPGICTTTVFNDYVRNNIVATQNVIEWAIGCNPNLKLFINAATSSIYGMQATQPETAVPQPISFYGCTKLAGEQLVLGAQRVGKLPACSLRLYSVYGPRERPEKLFTKLIKSIFDQKEFPLFQGSEKHSRSFTYVGDIVQAMESVLGIEKDVNGEVINIGSDLSYTTGQGIEFIENIIGLKAKITRIPAREGDQLRTNALIGKARKLLNYNPDTCFEDGLRAQVEWYREKFL